MPVCRRSVCTYHHCVHIMLYNISLGLLHKFAKPCHELMFIKMNTTSESLEYQSPTLQKKIVCEILARGAETADIVLPIMYGKDCDIYGKGCERDMSEVLGTITDEHSIKVSNCIPFFVGCEIKHFVNSGFKKDVNIDSSDLQVLIKPKIQPHICLSEQQETPCESQVLQTPADLEACKYILQRVKLLRKLYCAKVKLSEVILHVTAIEDSNLFIMSCSVPPMIVLDVMESSIKVDNNSFHTEHMAIPIDKWSQYYSELLKYGAEVCSNDHQTYGNLSPCGWTSSTIRNVFRLATIQMVKVQQSDNEIQMTITGKKDNCVDCEVSVHIKNNLRVEGAPEVGKTTLTADVCYLVKEDLVKQLSVAVFPQMLDPVVKGIPQAFSDLLPCSGVAFGEEVATPLSPINEWIFDGFDELQFGVFCNIFPLKYAVEINLRHCNCMRMSNLTLFCTKQCIDIVLHHNSSIIATFCPSSSCNIELIFSPQIDELCFNPDEKKDHPNDLLTEDLFIMMIKSCLVLAVCYISLYCAFAVHGSKSECQLLPSTEHDVYLSEHGSINCCHSEEKKCHFVPSIPKSFNAVSVNEVPRVQFVCPFELVCHGMVQNKVSFLLSDLPHESNKSSLLQIQENYLQIIKTMVNCLHSVIRKIFAVCNISWEFIFLTTEVLGEQHIHVYMV